MQDIALQFINTLSNHADLQMMETSEIKYLLLIVPLGLFIFRSAVNIVTYIFVEILRMRKI